MEPFKNIYNKKSLKVISVEIESFISKFDSKKFQTLCLKKLESLEMKDRVRLISQSLHSASNDSAQQNLKSIYLILKETNLEGFLLWPFSQYIEDYGLDYPKLSLKCLFELTQKFTAEFAIRAFLINHETLTFKMLFKWSTHPSEHLRRLTSEGSRPNLPWGINVPPLLNNLERNIELITPLAFDSSEYVRKSVANHLNDISRIDEKLFFRSLKNIEKQTSKSDTKTKKLIRHASRTLLKRGHPQALKLHGYNNTIKLIVVCSLNKKNVNEGEKLTVCLNIKNESKRDENLLIDYIVHYLKKNGQYSQKVFRLKDSHVQSNSELVINKDIPFRKVTTRVHYSGTHWIQIQVNGVKFSKHKFTLKCKE